MKIKNLFKNEYFWLTIIIVISFFARTYKLDSPIADWHSWRQADTAAVSRNFFKEGFNPLVPKYDDMSGVSDPPLINPERYRFVELPIYNSIVYFAYQIAGGVDERLARLVNIFISLGSLVFIYLLTKKYFDKQTAFIASLLFGLLPFSIYYSRVILPEPILVFFGLGGLFFTDKWIKENKISQFLLSFFFITGGLLTKPYVVFYFLPLLYSYLQKEGKIWPIPKRYFLLGILSVLPLVFWRFWINLHPEGIPASNWLLNGTNIRFKPVFWQWIFQDRFGREILAVFGSVLLAIGALIKPRLKENWFLHLFLLSHLIFLVVFATGNVQHDYYQTFIIPSVVIFTARGFSLLIKGLPDLLPKIWTIPLAFLLLFMTIYTGWQEVKGLYQINNDAIVKAGKAADRILPKDALIIAPYNGDTSFLYQTNRAGFPFIPLPIEELRQKYNISYLVSVAKDEQTKDAMQKYQVIEDTPIYVIIDLTRLNPDFEFAAEE